MFLFRIEQVFLIPEQGLVLTPGPESKIVKTGTKIKLVFPNKSVVETVIKGVAFNSNTAILIEASIKKEDIPIGTEVLLNEQE